MNILFVSYPMLPVSDASCGGAEQMLWTLEREMVRRGHETVVAGCENSRVWGRLVATGLAPKEPDAFDRRSIEHCDAVVRAVQEGRFDVVHDKSGFFWERSGEIPVSVLATLHLPRSFYRETLFENIPPNVSFNCVSESQAASFSGLVRLLGVVPNGISLERFHPDHEKSGYVLWLGRICPEKAPHLAMDAAERASVPLILAGQVYPFSWHQLYFDQEIRPRLKRMANVKWIEAPAFDDKVALLAKAKALLLPTLAAETSSLVSMEAMACGTPVIAFPNGALPEIVEDGGTGFLVADVDEMAQAIRKVEQLKPEYAREVAERRFSARIMAAGYENLYSRIVGDHTTKLAA